MQPEEGGFREKMRKGRESEKSGMREKEEEEREKERKTGKKKRRRGWRIDWISAVLLTLIFSSPVSDKNQIKLVAALPDLKGLRDPLSTSRIAKIRSTNCKFLSVPVTQDGGSVISLVGRVTKHPDKGKVLILSEDQMKLERDFLSIPGQA